MKYLLFSNLQTALILIATVIVVMGLISLFLNLHIRKNIKHRQQVMRNKLNSISLVLKAKYELINQKSIIFKEKDISIDEDKILASIQQDLDKDLEKISDVEYIVLLQNLSISLRKIDRIINSHINDLDEETKKQIQELNMQIIENEEYIQSTRRLFNSSASNFNHYISNFPNQIVAKMMKLTQYEYFHLEDLTEEYLTINLHM